MPQIRSRSLKSRFASGIAGLATAAALLSSAEPASACGGLFCSASNPVNQMAERIIFASDGDGNVICAVEILYEGPSEEFSWVLPVPARTEADIDVSVSSSAAFQRLQNASNPTYMLQTTNSCSGGQNRLGGFGAAANDSAGSNEGGESVVVVASGVTGPYAWELITVVDGVADPTDVAVDWLDANGYDTPPNGRDTLRPYLEDGLGLIAFKLTKNATTGSIRPVILKYPASVPSIPIRPTAVAATEDMGVLVWVLGDSRAVPINYRTLELNDSLIDWFNPQDTYNDVVIAAANEAGGQGFVTEQASPASAFRDVIWGDWERQQFDSLATVSPISAMLVEAVSNFGGLDGFADVLTKTVTLRDGVTAEAFVSCPWCYYEDVGIDPYGGAVDPTLDPSLETDRAAFLTALETDVIVPMEDTRQLFDDYAYVTRMYTTLSADEMTVDPDFDFNSELGDVDNNHIAEQTLGCAMGDEDPTWSITLPSGNVVSGQGQQWPNVVGDMPANTLVLQLATTGSGEVIEDNREEIRDHLRADGGCGCRVGGGTSPAPLGVLASVGLLGFAFARRRRA